jgi:hypothetical protein
MNNKVFVFIAIFSTTLFACSKSKTEPVPASISSVSQGLPVKRISHTFSATEDHELTNWIFNYSNNILVGGSAQVRHTWVTGKITSEPSESFNLTRSATTISGNLGGQPFTGTLNSSGYLASLSIASSDLICSYTSDGYLKKLIITDDFGKDIIDFTYSGGNLTAFQDVFTYNNTTEISTATLSYGSSLNKSGVWPAALDVEFGTVVRLDNLSMFYYAALLGKPTNNLAVSSHYQDSNLYTDDTYTYTYTDGYIATCRRNTSINFLPNDRSTTSDLITYAYN